MNAMNTHYPDPTRIEAVNRHTLAVVVDNEPGVLARIAGMFSGRGYNIESLTVSETEHEKHISRITIVTTGTNAVIEQIKSQLERLVPVTGSSTSPSRARRSSGALPRQGRRHGRPQGRGAPARRRLRGAHARRDAHVLRLRANRRTDEIERFISLMTVVGLVEVSRTGIAAMGRGKEGM